MELNEQGYLVKTCNLAKIGSLEYAGSEIGIDDKPNEIFEVYIDESELFSPSAIKSFEGLPVTLLHPDDLSVSAEDWKKKAVGHIQNIRRDGEFLVGDVYVQDSAAISIVEKYDIKELSCGYDSVLEFNNGKITKTQIKGNHLAIVPDGRCGDTCKIGDRGISMKPETKTKIIDSLTEKLKKLKGLKIGDADTAENKANEAQSQLQEAASAVEQAISAVEDVQNEVANTPETVVDEDTANPDNSDDKDAKIAELEAKVAELEEELRKRDEDSERTSTINDAMARFPKLKLGDAKTARDVRVKVLLDGKAFNQNELKLMGDAEIKAAYAAYKAVNPVRSNIGSLLLNDAKPAPVKTASQRLGGK